MNYYAVIAQLARVYNYMGEYEKAAHCAQEVLDAYAEAVSYTHLDVYKRQTGEWFVSLWKSDT